MDSCSSEGGSPVCTHVLGSLSGICTLTSLADGELQGAVYAGENLTAWDFSGADLTNANFTNAIAFQTNFEGATLTGANFTGVDLSTAILDGVVQPALAACPTALPEKWVCLDNHLWGPGVDYSGVNFGG